MKKNKYLKPGIIVLALVLSMTLHAQRGSGNGYGAQTCESKIPDLTDQQKEDIENLRVEHRAKMMSYKADLNIMQAELQKLEISSEPNKKLIESKIDEIYVLKSNMAKSKSEHRQEVRNLLSNEQKVYFDSHHAKRKGNGRDGSGKGNNAHCQKRS